MSEIKPNLVFFGIEISDLERDAAMLQIVMKSGKSAFNSYVNPVKPISVEMTKINHLTVRSLRLYRDGVRKKSRPLAEVMELLLEYLKQFDGPCTLVGHKYCFSDAFRLIRAIKQLSMENEFAAVINGFTNTFKLFEEKFPKKEAKDLVLHKLAAEADLTWTHPFKCGRSVKHNTILLEKLTLNSFSVDELKVQKSFVQQVRYCENSKQGPALQVTGIELLDTVASPPPTRARKLKRALRIKENQENVVEKVSEKTKKNKHDTKEFSKRSKVIADASEIHDYSVSLRTRTNMDDNTTWDF